MLNYKVKSSRRLKFNIQKNMWEFLYYGISGLQTPLTKAFLENTKLKSVLYAESKIIERKHKK